MSCDLLLPLQPPLFARRYRHDERGAFSGLPEDTPPYVYSRRKDTYSSPKTEFVGGENPVRPEMNGKK